LIIHVLTSKSVKLYIEVLYASKAISHIVKFLADEPEDNMRLLRT